MQVPDYEVSDLDLFWVAGLLEGEGSFMSRRNIVSGKLYLYPAISVNMTDRDVIERVATIFSTSVYDIPETSIRPGCKLQYRALITGSRAAGLMKKLLPIMGSRRAKKIKEILEDYEELEDLETRRRRSCKQAQQNRRAREREL